MEKTLNAKIVTKLSKGKKRKMSTKNIVFLTLIGVFMGIYCLSLVMPIAWSALTSLKSVTDYVKNPSPFPKKLIFANYSTAMSGLEIEIFRKSYGSLVQFNIVNMFTYSLIIASVQALMAVLQPTIVAYMLSQYNFPGKGLLIKVNILVMILPIVGALPSALVIKNALGLYNNIVPFLLTTGSPFGMNLLILMGFFKALPKEYKEAASIDGAGHFKIMMQIYMPMIIPLLTALFMLAFISSWNDYMTIIVWLPSYPNLAYGVYIFGRASSVTGFSVPEIQAGYIIVSIPSVLLWSLSQNLIAKHMMVGGLKG